MTQSSPPPGLRGHQDPAWDDMILTRRRVSDEVVLEIPGDYAVVNVQQRGDATFVVLRADPSGEAAQRAYREKVDEVNAGERPDPLTGEVPVADAAVAETQRPETPGAPS